jgi:hypothetical protein
MPTIPFKNSRGAAILEFCLILPVLVIIVFAIVDFGRLIQARLIITNVTREGGNLASRDIKSGNDLIAMLRSSARPLDLNGSGRICITNIEAGRQGRVNPVILNPQVCSGSINRASGISAGASNLGLTPAVYNHLVFDPGNQSADINGVTVVETFFMFTPITPLPRFIANILLNDGNGMIIGSRSVFCSTGR